MTYRHIIILLLAALSMALVRCSGTSAIAGNTSSETTNGFAAAIIYPNGMPAAHVMVKLRRADYLADTAVTAAKVLASQENILTDEAGRFCIQTVDIGEYLIEASDTHGNAVAISCEATSDSVFDLGVQTLVPLGEITGTLGGPDVAGIVRVRGLDRYVYADSAGIFTLSVPAGLAYSITITTADSTAEISTTPVQSSQTISIAADLGSYHTDSLAIRTFLNSMGLDTVSVNVASIIDTVSGRIRGIDLSSRGLTAILPAIGSLSFLWAIDAGNNPLTGVPSTLGRIPFLATLILDNTNIAALPASIGDCTNLQWLALGATGIRSLPPELSQLSLLQSLDLSDDSLTTVPPVVYTLTALRSLGLSRNLLTQIPATLGNLTQLEYLHLDDNRLDSLPQEIGALRNLKALYAYLNNLAAIPASIARCDSLRLLHLENNNLTTLPDEIVNVRPVEGLSLNSNRLCNVSAEISAWADMYAKTIWRASQTCP